MSDLGSRLDQCFTTVFPDLPQDEIREAVLDGTPQWDSMATVLLITVLEEEFAISIAPDDFATLISYQAIAEYLRQRSREIRA